MRSTQQLQNELEAARQALEAAARDAAQGTTLSPAPVEGEVPPVMANGWSSSAPGQQQHPPGNASSDAAVNGSKADEAYVQKLEEELELVTEQLIETEKRLSETETHVTEMEALAHNLEESGAAGRREEDEDLIQSLQAEAADLKAHSGKLQKDLSVCQEELALAKEEISLQQEELQRDEECGGVNTLR